MKPSDKLSPKTRMAFGSAAGAFSAKTIDMMIRNLATHFIQETSSVRIVGNRSNDPEFEVER